MIEPFKKKALDRLKRAKGQTEGIIKMIEGGQYCPEILTQLRAVEGALRGASQEVLESHLHTCGAANLNSADKTKKRKFIQELLKAFSLSSR